MTYLVDLCIHSLLNPPRVVDTSWYRCRRLKRREPEFDRTINLIWGVKKSAVKKLPSKNRVGKKSIHITRTIIHSILRCTLRIARETWPLWKRLWKGPFATILTYFSRGTLRCFTSQEDTLFSLLISGGLYLPKIGWKVATIDCKI